MMNAETNRLAALSKGATESQKAQAEESKANIGLATQVIKTIGEANKINQDKIP